MSVIHSLRQRAKLALSHLEAGEIEKAKAILQQDAQLQSQQRMVAGSPVTNEFERRFAKLRRQFRNVPAAMCYIGNSAYGRGGFYFFGENKIVDLMKEKIARNLEPQPPKEPPK